MPIGESLGTFCIRVGYVASCVLEFHDIPGTTTESLLDRGILFHPVNPLESGEKLAISWPILEVAPSQQES